MRRWGGGGGCGGLGFLRRGGLVGPESECFEELWRDVVDCGLLDLEMLGGKWWVQTVHWTLEEILFFFNHCGGLRVGLSV